MENPILQKQSISILQQIEELKNWHKQQQSKLDTNAKTEKFDTLPYQISEDTTCKYLTRSPLQKKSVTQQNFDEIPIKVVNPNLNKVIENNINPNDHADKNLQNGEKPKFKFLKRGEGIARFRMGPQKIPKSKTKNIWTLNLSAATKVPKSEFNSFKDQKPMDEEHRKDVDNVDTLNPPDLKLDMKNWKSIFNSGKAEEIIEKAISSNQLNFFQPDSSVDSSFMEKFIAVGKKHIREREELKVFEAIEQHLLDSSFCSNSSYVARLMENAVISTPIKKTFENKTCQDIQTKTTQLPTVVMQNKEEIIVEKNTENLRPQPAVWNSTENIKEANKKLQDSADSDNLEQSLHVRFAEEVDYKSFVDYSQSVDNSQPNIVNSDKELNESEEWKEESGEDSICCSQCSTTYSSSDEDVKAISPPGKPKLRSRFPKYNSVKKNMQVNKTASKVLDVVDLTTKTEQDRNTISSTDEAEKFPPILGSKLKELEVEIDTFREENKKLKALRETLEKDRKQFYLQKKKFLIDFDEEKKKSAAQLEEEKQKLAKEKFTFEKYSKSLSKNPSKEERKEIQGLKEQLTELKEELNRKESRWGAAQARVRNQVKVLEEDNKKLREEVEVLRKQAKHLEFLTNKRKSKPVNNTKLIHAFNEYILNTPVEDEGISKSLSLGGYFDSKPNSAKTVVIHEVNPSHSGTTRVINEKGKENKLPTGNSGYVANSVEETHKPVTIENNNLNSKFSHTTKPFKLDNKGTLQNLEKISPTGKADSFLNSPKEVINEDGSVENIYSDGKREIRFKNGNVKRIDPFSGNEKTIYFNGDVKENLADGTVKYYFSESRIWHTTLPDGLEVLDFPNGQVEKRHTNGMVEIVFPNECRKLSFPDGSEEICYADGTKLKIQADKKKILLLPNGQREVHTDECVKREYPDGTVKKVYPDGVTETIYANGRVRLKDRHGNLVMDSATLNNRL